MNFNVKGASKKVANEKGSVFKKIIGWLVAVVGGIFALLCFKRRSGGDVTQGFNEVRKELADVGTELEEAKDTVGELEDTINDSERAVSESRNIIERVKRKHK